MAATPLTTAEAVLLARFIAARAAQAQVRPISWGTCLAQAAVMVGLVVAGAPRWFVGLWGLLLLAGVAVSWWLHRTLRRIGVLDRLADLEHHAAEAQKAWWPNLQAELRRVGIAPTPLTLLRIARARARRGSRGLSAEREALAQVDWMAVMPHAQWHEARRLLAEVARDRPPAGGIMPA